MAEKLRNRLLVILACSILSALAIAPSFVHVEFPSWWPSKGLRLGLDLKGGTYLVLGVKTPEAVRSHLRSVANSLGAELRKEKIGVLRAREVNGQDVEVTVLGEKGRDMLDGMVRKDFPELGDPRTSADGQRQTVTYHIKQERAVEIERFAVEQAIETIRNRVDQYGVAEPVIQRVGEKRIMVQLPSETDLDKVKKTIGSVAQLEFRLVPEGDALSKGIPTSTIRTREGGSLVVQEEILMSGDAVRTAQVDVNPRTNEIEVVLRLTSVGAKTFERITGENVGKRLAIILDGVSYSAPVIRDRIGGGVAQITGGFTSDEAHRLAIVLRSGALPAPLTFEEQRTVGASLGEDSIRSGVIASVVASLAVCVFAVFYYRKFGVIAVVGLALNVLFLLGLLSLLGGTITLPGIAGLGLTVGMAIDGNILVYERIREELEAGNTALAAIEAGFHRAHRTILDANLTHLLTAVILYAYGTGPIKGFAVTLCLGILTTLFTVLFVAKTFVDWWRPVTREGGLSI